MGEAEGSIMPIIMTDHMPNATKKSETLHAWR